MIFSTDNSLIWCRIRFNRTNEISLFVGTPSELRNLNELTRSSAVNIGLTRFKRRHNCSKFGCDVMNWHLIWSLLALCNNAIVCNARITVSPGSVRKSDGFDGNFLKTCNGFVADLKTVSNMSGSRFVALITSENKNCVWNSLSLRNSCEKNPIGSTLWLKSCRFNPRN